MMPNLWPVVRWTLEDAVLVLEDAAGRRQQWRRRV
jgi:hypothetical protein